MKVVLLGAAVAGLWLVAGTGPADTLPFQSGLRPEATHAPVAHVRAASTSTSPIAPEDLTKVVQRYCVVCHNDAMLTGNQTFQTFAVERASERAETAEKMILKLRAGMMPPPGAPRPGPDTLLALVEALESNVDAAAKATPHAGSRRFARLNRAEYDRAIHDVLDLDVDASKWLPPDVLSGSFDNMSASQQLTPTLLEAYLRAATDVSLLALGNPNAVSVSAYYKNPNEVSQHAWDHVEGTPFGTRGGMAVKHHFPADGNYVFSIDTRFGSGKPNALADEDLDVSMDGESVATLMLPHQSTGLAAPLQTEPIFVTAGEHEVSAAFVNLVDGTYDDRFIPPDWSAAGGSSDGYGITGMTHLAAIGITGPDKVTGVSETASRKKVFVCRPASAQQERPCAEKIITDVASRAYRRPASKAVVADLLAFYEDAAAAGGFETGIRAGLQAILASPEFVFRFEREPAGAEAGKSYRLSDIDLATRLSFFLWATVPDQELIQVAQRGKLSNPSELEKQVRRMLADPRSEALATRFAYQWLRLQDVAKVWPEPFLFPSFSKQLADAMVRESELFFDHLVQEDRGLLELFNADYTFLNERLARFYGIDGVAGDEFRLVKYPNEQRRGILSHGSVLKSTSMSERTSPVLRGKWVMEVIMGTPPPPPPPNVPALDATGTGASGRRLTTRERMEQHRKNPVCVSCHNFIDPIGLALDNFDPTGQWRIRENMEPLDTRGVF
ncbi:MAG: DUF1592 domain-containing protein, partial [Gemmatimonadetes bacterium]|nr:DUF1592 domain-containing protein [Gemmatimonadota bacterium]